MLFHALDPLPYRERDLDPEVEAFVVEWASEIGPGRVSEIRIHTSARPLDPDPRQVETAVQTFFKTRATVIGQQTRNLLRQGRTSLLIGVTVLAGSNFVSHLALQFATRPFGAFLAEGLVIFGWVANWRPVEIFLYDWWPLVRQQQLYRRLSQCRVTVVTSDNTGPAV